MKSTTINYPLPGAGNAGAGKAPRHWTFARVTKYVAAPAVFLAGMVFWETYVHVTGLSDLVLPAPTQILQALIAGLSSGLYVPHFLTTFTEVAVGFSCSAVLALVIGGLVSQFRIVEAAIYPFIVGLQTMPKIALAPLILLWVGFGIESKIVTAGLVAFFPMIVSTITGLRSTPPEKIDLLRALGANRYKIFKLVQLPEALPFIFAGLNIGIVMSVLGAIVGEFVGSKKGLGYLLIQFNYNMDIAGMFAVLVILSVMGLILNFSIQGLRAKIIFWRKPSVIIR